jgi:hypothetical protein
MNTAWKLTNERGYGIHKLMRAIASAVWILVIAMNQLLKHNVTVCVFTQVRVDHRVPECRDVAVQVAHDEDILYSSKRYEASLAARRASQVVSRAGEDAQSTFGVGHDRFELLKDSCQDCARRLRELERAWADASIRKPAKAPPAARADMNGRWPPHGSIESPLLKKYKFDRIRSRVS